ncbi:uncharacterized protein BDV14DRAFT_168004 [Aspergillus stella-maris]|uniref:uncharacterized protein n=1 Tax=Aspergillus stella-maris TaxID=1810926 RepID=UPI003CCD69AA
MLPEHLGSESDSVEVHTPSKSESLSLSRLEELPAEILQEIFLVCLEINLPRASIALGQKLSSQAIYTWLIRLAFAEVDGIGVWNGEGELFLTREFLPPIDSVRWILGSDELRKVRSRILECRWCTLPLIRSCQLAFLEYVIRYKGCQVSIDADDLHLFNGLLKWSDRLKSCGKAPNGQLGEGDIVLRAYEPEHGPNTETANTKPSHDHNITVWFNPGIVEVLSVRNRALTGNIHFELPYCEDTALPEKLLHAPWSGEKLEFLQLLSTRAVIDNDTEYLRATRVLRTLIRERDFVTFAQLLDMHVRVACYAFPVLWPATSQVFRAALKYADEQGDLFVGLLVEKRWGDIENEELGLKERLMRKALTSQAQGL